MKVDLFIWQLVKPKKGVYINGYEDSINKWA
jgi:hypothetical protein